MFSQTLAFELTTLRDPDQVQALLQSSSVPAPVWASQRIPTNSRIDKTASGHAALRDYVPLGRGKKSFLLAPVMILLSPYIVANYLPPYTTPWLLPIDVFFHHEIGIWFVGLTGLLIGLMPRTSAKKVSVALLVLVLAYTATHDWTYFFHFTTANRVENLVRTGDTVFMTDFEEDAGCAARTKVNDLNVGQDFTKCWTADGALHAHLDSPKLPAFATYTTGQVRLANDFYLVTTARAESGGSVAACGLTVGVSGSLTFYVSPELVGDRSAYTGYVMTRRVSMTDGRKSSSVTPLRIAAEPTACMSPNRSNIARWTDTARLASSPRPEYFLLSISRTTGMGITIRMGLSPISSTHPTWSNRSHWSRALVSGTTMRPARVANGSSALS